MIIRRIRIFWAKTLQKGTLLGLRGHLNLRTAPDLRSIRTSYLVLGRSEVEIPPSIMSDRGPARLHNSSRLIASQVRAQALALCTFVA